MKMAYCIEDVFDRTVGKTEAFIVRHKGNRFTRLPYKFFNHCNVGFGHPAISVALL